MMLQLGIIVIIQSERGILDHPLDPLGFDGSFGHPEQSMFGVMNFHLPLKTQQSATRHPKIP